MMHGLWRLSGERTMSAVKFRVRGFAGGRHPDAKFGALLLETVHSTETSAYVEIEAWKERMKRGEVSKVELIDCCGGLTNLNVQPYTDIPWSWRRAHDERSR